MIRRKSQAARRGRNVRLSRKTGSSRICNRSMFFLVKLLGILTHIFLTQSLVLVVYKAKELFLPC